MGKECVRRASELLESSAWKLEKLTNEGDTIKSTTQPKLGKVWRLTVCLTIYNVKIRLPASFNCFCRLDYRCLLEIY